MFTVQLISRLGGVVQPRFSDTALHQKSLCKNGISTVQVEILHLFKIWFCFFFLTKPQL